MSDLQLKIRPDDTDCTHELDGPTTPIENRMLVGTCSICGSQVAEFIDNDGTPTGMSLIVEPGYLESAPSRCEPRPTLVACRIETNSMWGRLMRYAFYFRDDRDNC